MRIIARLDIKLNKLIKSIMYEGVRQLGNPEEFAQNYYNSGIDELILIILTNKEQCLIKSNSVLFINY